jgi:hypothetical protein
VPLAETVDVDILRVAAALAGGNEGVVVRTLFVEAHVAHSTIVCAILIDLSYSLLSFDGVIRVFCTTEKVKKNEQHVVIARQNQTIPNTVVDSPPSVSARSRNPPWLEVVSFIIF